LSEKRSLSTAACGFDWTCLNMVSRSSGTVRDTNLFVDGLLSTDDEQTVSEVRQRRVVFVSIMLRC
jgi:hypothetical protein